MRRQDNEGFSLVELMIAVLLTIGLMGVVFGLMNSSQQVFTAQSGVVDMSQQVRTAVDLLTRDLQSAGTGLVVPSGIGTGGCLAAVFYTDGASGAPDTIMIVNGDNVAPTAQVSKQLTATTQFVLLPPPDVKSTDAGLTFKYADFQNNNVAKSIYLSAGNDPTRKYLVYDQNSVMMFTLGSNAIYAIDSGSQVINIQYNTLTNVAGTYSTLIGTAVNGNAAPNYAQAEVAVLGATIAYRLDPTTRELMRTDNLVNWYTVARGIVDFQIQYRVISRPLTTIEEMVVNKPGVDAFTSGQITARRGIRAIIVTLVSETPDLDAADKGYRIETHRVEITPRNLNFSDNNNLSAGL